jgi:hypothetical protein
MVRFYMTTKTTLSDEEMAERGTHSCSPRATRNLCAFAAPSVQGRSNTVPSPDGEFLIANPELEFELNRRKQSLLRISNRKYFAIFSLALPRVSPAPKLKRAILIATFAQLRIRLNPALSLVTHFLTATKSTFSPFACRPAFLLAKALPAI